MVATLLTELREWGIIYSNNPYGGIGMKKIVVEGHRGYCAKYPENTLISFEAAIDLGVDAFEFDVWLAKDKTPVVIHDGNGHSLFVILPIDHDIESTDITYEYYLDGELLSDSEGNPVQSVSEAGEYSVRAIFTVQNPNYEQIEDMFATLRIEEGN